MNKYLPASKAGRTRGEYKEAGGSVSSLKCLKSEFQAGTTLEEQWLGLGALTARARVPSLI